MSKSSESDFAGFWLAHNGKKEDLRLLNGRPVESNDCAPALYENAVKSL